MNQKTITEGKAKIKAYVSGVVSKNMPVFYNPVMKFNRDTCILLLNSIDKKDMQIADLMAGSGIRAIRLLLELKKEKIRSISLNDLSEESVKIIKENINLNEKSTKTKEISITNRDANIFLLESSGFDYIDIDPFGSPVKFLDSAVERIARNGVLAVTATDTAPLCGTYPATCKRKYWATPIRNEHMHEIGLRILIRKVQLVSAQYEKALTPIFSFYKDHYFRTYLICEKQKTKADEILKSHKYFHYCSKCLNFFVSGKNGESCCTKNMETAGPLWAGEINDEKLVKKMAENNKEKENTAFLKTILEESKVDAVGFIDLHAFSKKYRREIPKTGDILRLLRQNGFLAEKTIFGKYGIKTDAKIKNLLTALNVP